MCAVPPIYKKFSQKSHQPIAIKKALDILHQDLSKYLPSQATPSNFMFDQPDQQVRWDISKISARNNF
jgi:hypothetical protein